MNRISGFDWLQLCRLEQEQEQSPYDIIGHSLNGKSLGWNTQINISYMSEMGWNKLFIKQFQIIN